jgi:integrase
VTWKTSSASTWTRISSISIFGPLGSDAEAGPWPLAIWSLQACLFSPKGGLGSDDLLFGTRKNTPIDLHNAVARHIKPTAARLGLPAVCWHDVRRTFTTWGRRAGIKARNDADQLRHSSVLMTLDVYSHADDRTVEAAIIERYAWPESAVV